MTFESHRLRNGAAGQSRPTVTVTATSPARAQADRQARRSRHRHRGQALRLARSAPGHHNDDHDDRNLFTQVVQTGLN